jgi:hypothetical protein
VAVPVHIPRKARLLTGDISLVVLLAFIEQTVLAGCVVRRDFRGIIAWVWLFVVVQLLCYL